MGKEITTSGNTYIEKHNIFGYKNPIFFFNDVDIDNMFISIEISYSKKDFKYFTGYLGNFEIKPFSIILPKTNVYTKRL